MKKTQEIQMNQSTYTAQYDDPYTVLRCYIVDSEDQVDLPPKVRGFLELLGDIEVRQYLGDVLLFATCLEEVDDKYQKTIEYLVNLLDKPYEDTVMARSRVFNGKSQETKKPE